MAYKIILDPGHGGSDPGANFNGRQEKDDALALAMAVGKFLTPTGTSPCWGACRAFAIAWSINPSHDQPEGGGGTGPHAV